MKSACTICNQSLETTVVRGFKTANGVYDVCMCSDCMVAATVPMPSRKEMMELYSKSYRSEEGRRFNRFVELFILLMRLRRKMRIKRYIKKGRILDIGCGRGLGLEVMRRDGWQVAGVEFTEEAASYASKTYGLNVVSGAVGEWGFPDDYFDVITISHVLEHVEEPSLMVKECRKLLKKTGLLLCAVPDISSLQAAAGKGRWFHLDIPYHLHHFTETGLKRLLSKNGFKILRTRRFDLEHNPYGWLQTLLNMSGIRRNFLYTLLKKSELRQAELERARITDFVLTVTLLPLYLPVSFILSLFESSVLRRGGTVEVCAVKE